MFNPREAADDSRALNIAILFFAAVTVVFTIALHFDSAAKYWLLTQFGKTSAGTILRVSEAPKDPHAINALARESPRNYLKNRQTWVSGDTLLIEFQPDNARTTSFFFKRPAGSPVGQANTPVPVVYLPVNPKIAHPQAHLADFAFDSKIMRVSLIAAALIVWLFIEALVSWVRLRQTMRRY